MIRRLALLAAFLVSGCDGIRLEPEHTLASIEIVPGDTVILEGDPVKLQVQARDNTGEIIEIPAWRKPQWSVTDSKILQISGGEIIGISGGKESKVTVLIAGLSATARIRVNPLWDVEATGVYINQVAQFPPEPLPLIANRRGMLRIFLTLDGFHTYEPPEILIQLSNEYGLVIDTILTQEFPDVLREPDESKFAYTYNLLVPARDIRSGLKAVLTYDPADRQHGIQGRETFEFDVRPLPTYRQVLVPVINNRAPSDRTIQWARAQSNESADMQLARQILPVADRVITIREPYSTDANYGSTDIEVAVTGWHRLLNEITTLRVLDNATEYYYGAMELRRSVHYLGLGWICGRGLFCHPVSIGNAGMQTFTHELGHNMSLLHAPCKGDRVSGRPDPDYPYASGSIGFWGWNPDTGRLLDPDRWSDFMGSCPNNWIGWYHFELARDYREFEETHVLGDGAAESVLLIWGGIDEAGQIDLDPAMLLNAPASGSDDGPYLVEAFAETGERVFRHRFTPMAISHSDQRLFNVMIPYDPAESPSISSITVSGPGSTMTLTEGSQDAMAFVIDRSTDRITAIRRNWRGDVRTGTRVLYSTGVPVKANKW